MIMIFSILNDSEKQIQNCVNLITVWMLTFPQRGIFHVGIVFCRSVMLSTIPCKSDNLRIFLERRVRAAARDGGATGTKGSDG